MKIAKRLLIWTLIACVVEVVTFGYIDKFFLKPESNFKAVKVEIRVDEKQAPKVEIKVPDSLNLAFKTSSNGRFMLYKEDSSLKIFNTISGDIDEIKPEANESFSFFRWVPDTTRVLIVKKDSEKKKFNLYYYDVNIKGKLTQVRNYMDGSMEGQEVSIAMRHPKAEVEDIDLSTLNGVLYIKVLNNGRHTEVYRMDRMAYLTRVNNYELKSFMLGHINSTKRSEKLIYEDLIYGKVYATGVKSALVPSGVAKVKLLGLDMSDDTIYIGEVQDDKITKVYFGLAEQTMDKWNSLALTLPRKPEEIVIGTGGKIYINDNLEGKITELKTWEQTEYSGRMLQIYDGGILSVTNSVLNNQKLVQSSNSKTK
jgi:hypothetical protein